MKSMKKEMALVIGLLSVFAIASLVSLCTSCSRESKNEYKDRTVEVEKETEYPLVLIDEMDLNNVMVIPRVNNGKVESLDVYFNQENSIVIDGVNYYLIKLAEDKDCFYIYSIENPQYILKSNDTLKVKVNEYRIAKDGSWKYLVETVYLDWKAPEEYWITPEETSTPENSGAYDDGEDWK